jgi:hypothetical protein
MFQVLRYENILTTNYTNKSNTRQIVYFIKILSFQRIHILRLSIPRFETFCTSTIMQILRKQFTRRHTFAFICSCTR